MRYRSLYFIAGILSVIGSAVGLSYFGVLPLESIIIFERPTTVTVIDRVLSPDGEYVATTHRATDGGAWCEERTNVHKSSETFDWEREYVFNIKCGCKVEMKWEGLRNLAITYSYDNAGVANTSRQFLSKDNAVDISYSLMQ